MALTVADVSARLGSVLVVDQIGRLDAVVTGTLVTDPEYPISPTEGALIVAPGFRAHSAAFRDLMRTAIAARSAAILLKGPLPVHFGSDDIAVIGVDSRTDWGQLLGLIRAASETSRVTDYSEDSLFGLADAIAASCGGPVVLHDPAWQLLAYSGGAPMDEVRNESILGRRAPAAPLAELGSIGLLDSLERGDVIAFQDNEIAGMSRRYAVAVQAGTELLATIWLQPDGEASHREIEVRLRKAADNAALPLLRHAAAGLGGASSGDAAFSALLAGKQTERIVAERLGVELDAGFVLCAMRPTTADERDRAATARRLRALARSYCDAFRVRAQLAVGPDTTYLVFPAADQEQRQSAVRIVSDIHGRLQSTAPHRALVSSTYHSLTETRAVSLNINELLELAERRGWTGLTDSEHLQASWRLEQFREVALAHPALLSGPISRLSAQDRAHQTHLVDTLRTYFDCVGDMKIASQKLGLHVNTVRYRINKAQEIGRFSLDDPDDRLLAELQVRLVT